MRKPDSDAASVETRPSGSRKGLLALSERIRGATLIFGTRGALVPCNRRDRGSFVAILDLTPPGISLNATVGDRH